MTGRIARCGLVCALALILFAPSSAAAAPRTRAGASIARDLALGHRVVLEGVTVTGPVSLSDEVSAALGMTVAALKSRMHRARASLRRALVEAPA